MRARRLLLLCAACACARAQDVTVVQKTLAMEAEHALPVDRSTEYILLFAPTAEQSAYPTRLWLHSAGAELAHPLLVTARLRTGALTWQLPYLIETALLHELQRTLCPDDGDAPTDCEGGAEARRGHFSLHVASSCAARATLRLRAAPARDFALAHSANLTATLTAPSVHRFAAWGDASAVRLVVAAAEDVCATLVVQPLTCPIAQTTASLEPATVRTTMLRSGGMQLSRSRFEGGFYVVVIVSATNWVCGEADEEADEGADGDWLWEAAVLDATRPPARAAAPRAKRLTYEIKASLSWREYAVGTSVALAFFLAWYVAFGALVLAQRWPAWYNLVRPRAVLAAPPPTTPQEGDEGAMELRAADSAAPAAARRRRDSTATFDGSDLSDTDSEGEQTDLTATTAAGASPTPEGASQSPEGMSPEPERRTPPLAGPVAAAGNALSANGNGEVALQILNRTDGTGSTGLDEQQSAGAVRAFGLPARLHVARLARRRGRVLRARSMRYLYALNTVAVFYALPVLQFVAAFQLVLLVTGSLDLCYYNWLCAHPLGALHDFNHVVSNAGYLLLGALLVLQQARRARLRRAAPRSAAHGLPPHDGLDRALGAGMMVVALLSASYHVCPNSLNFQFDTAFMYVLAVLSSVKIYQARHPDIAARAHATFGVLAVLIALVVWGVLGGGALFWSVFTVLHVFTFLLLSLRIYYLGQFRLEKASMSEAARTLRAPTLYGARLAALLAANAVHWAFALYGLLAQPQIASHLLFVLLANALLHMVYYVSMKLAHGEHLRWYAWLYVGGAAAAWAPALYYFLLSATMWTATPARSRHVNHECKLLSFYDSHDLWHGLSAVALYLTFSAMMCWDDGLAAVPRDQIPVF